MSIELVGETEFETSLLEKAFGRGKLSRGNGDSKCENGYQTGFYIEVPIADEKPTEP